MPTNNRADFFWIALALLSGAIYIAGLGSSYAPTNGDEMVYIHIARMTSESGHWLPLQSELLGTRNTKPPLLIWQAMVAGNWGAGWNLFALRLPSVIYTFATTALLAFFAFRVSGKVRAACIAAALYLLFFSTFRYGRAYLTSAPETFWLALPMWWLLWLSLKPAGSAPHQKPDLTAYTLFGIAMGLGAAYKSFALLAPAAATLWCAVLCLVPRPDWRALWRTSAGVAWSTAIGLGIFALWFVLDPDPAAVWQEFVVAENAGKMSGGQGYWHAALYGTYPMWTQLLAYPENAGLLALPVLGFCWLALKQAFQQGSFVRLNPSARVLLVWLLVWLVVFTIPSQRSARYVIPAMPALAIAMALAWERIAKPWFWVTALVCVPALVMLGRIGWVMGDMQIAQPLQIAMLMIAVCAGCTGAIALFVYKNTARPGTLITCLAVYAAFGLMVAPLANPQANYSPAVTQQMAGRTLAVPNGFTGQYERFHLIFPGARISPFDAEGRNTGVLQPELAPAQRLVFLLEKFDAVVWLDDNLDADTPGCTPRCKVLGSRWHVRSRHKEGEVTLDNLWYPQRWLFGREWLLTLNGA